MGTHEMFGQVDSDDVAGLATRLAAIEARLATWANDRVLYGDVFSPYPRMLALTNNVVMTSGQLYAGGVYAETDETISELRVATGTAASAGSGSLRLGLYTGASPTSLTQRATAAAFTSAPASTLLASSITSTSVTAGSWVYVFILATGFTTFPTLRFITGGGPGSAMINPTSRLVAVQSGQSVLPATANLSAAGWSGSGGPLWFAAA